VSPAPTKTWRRGTQTQARSACPHGAGGRAQAEACATVFQKIQEGGGGSLGLLFEDPVGGVFQNDMVALVATSSLIAGRGKCRGFSPHSRTGMVSFGLRRGNGESLAA